MFRLMLIAAALWALWPLSARSVAAGSHVRWVKAIGEQAYLEACYGVDVASDQGFILAGRRSADTPGAKSNAYFVRTDGEGQVRWTAEVDPFPNFASHSRLLDVVAADDGGFVAAGWAESPDYGDEGYLVKIDAAGRLQWHYIYGNVNMGGGDEDDRFEAMAKTRDGGYILAGTTEALAQRGWTDAWLVKVDANGRIEWSRTYGGDGLEYAYDVIQSEDGGYVFVGSTNSFGDETRTYLQKTLSNGDQAWLQVYDANGSDEDGEQEGRGIRQSMDGGYMVAGWYAAGADPGFPFFAKFDAAGNWQQAMGSAVGDGNDVFSALTSTGDGGFLAVGRTNSRGQGSYDVLTVKTGQYGIIRWSETIGAADYDAAYAVQTVGTRDAVVCGKTVGRQWPGGTDMLLIRMEVNPPPKLKYKLYVPVIRYGARFAR